jgi:formate dehydrogenase major subunit
VQGTFALTIDGRGFDSRVSPGQNEAFMDSECVSCGACVQACPTATLIEKSVVEKGQADHAITTTCAYCGVGCSFNAEMKGAEVVRMIPNKDGHANHGHSCVKGRFAFGYATHKDRITKPMIRSKITDPWKEVSWEEAIAHAASEFKRIQAKYGQDSVGGLTSSRCTNEETYLATTTWIPVPVSAIHRPAMDSSRPSVSRRVRRPSIPFENPMCCLSLVPILRMGTPFSALR